MNPKIVYGMHPVASILNTKIKIEELWILKGLQKNKLDLLQKSAAQRNIPIRWFENRKELDKLTGDEHNQGVAATIKTDATYCALEELKDAKIVLMLDHLTDLRNFGAILRTCDLFQIDGVIIPEDRSCDLHPIAIKASSGAAFFVKVAKVTNLNRALEKLKDWGFWSYAAVGAEGEALHNVKWSEKNVIILGSEGSGIAQQLLKNSDFKITIPTQGHIDSLNVSVAAGIILYQAASKVQ